MIVYTNVNTNLVHVVIKIPVVTNYSLIVLYCTQPYFTVCMVCDNRVLTLKYSML